MARRSFGRRRKPRVVWLPTFGIAHPDEGTGIAPSGVTGILNLTDADVTWDAFTLTFDTQLSPQFFEEREGALNYGEVRTLNEIVGGSEYRLRRIVGKFFASATSDELDDPAAIPALVDCAFGFIVCRTDDFGSPQTDFNLVNPLGQDSMDDPWIWRRRWVLNPYGNADPINVTFDRRAMQYELYPNTTAGYGSVADGPHIDQKTARVIRADERLFGVIAARAWYPDPANTIAFADKQLRYLLDYRLLGSLRPSSSGNRRNASR